MAVMVPLDVVLDPPAARNVPEGLDPPERTSTAGGVGDTEARGGSGGFPSEASAGNVGGGRIDERAARKVCAGAVGATGDGAGIGVGRRGAGIGAGVDLRAASGGTGVSRLSGGGIVDLRVEGGNGVDLSGGGIVDLRGAGGGNVPRLSMLGGAVDFRVEGGCGGGTVERRFAEDGSGVKRAPSSSRSDPSPLRGSTAGVFVEERRDEPRTELIGEEASGGGFPIVTPLTLVQFPQRVRSFRRPDGEDNARTK